MRKTFLFLIVGLMSVMMASSVSAIPLAQHFEMDLDNWTRLYDESGNVVPEGDFPVVGYESRAFIKINQIGETTGPGGPDQPAYWTGGTNGEYLIGVEKNVKISQVSAQGGVAGTVIYFDHVTNDPLDPQYWEVELYKTGISYTTFEEIGDGSAGDPFGNYLGLGPANFGAIETALATPSSLFLQGRFAQSTYYDLALDLADGTIDNSPDSYVNALVAIHLPWDLSGGTWVDQVTFPYGLRVNTFLDVNPVVGSGGLLIDGFYGIGPDGSEYDMAIQNVRLESEIGVNVNYDAAGNPLSSTGGNWIVSDDGLRGTVPEPATMLLLGSGLVGLAGLARKKRNKK